VQVPWLMLLQKEHLWSSIFLECNCNNIECCMFACCQRQCCSSYFSGATLSPSKTSCFLFFGPPLIAICNNMLLNNFRIFSCLILFIFVAFLVCNSSICLLFAASFCCLHFNVSLGTLRKYLPFYCEYLYRHGSQPRILMFN